MTSTEEFNDLKQRVKELVEQAIVAAKLLDDFCNDRINPTVLAFQCGVKAQPRRLESAIERVKELL